MYRVSIFPYFCQHQFSFFFCFLIYFGCVAQPQNKSHLWEATWTVSGQSGSGKKGKRVYLLVPSTHSLKIHSMEGYLPWNPRLYMYTASYASMSAGGVLGCKERSIALVSMKQDTIRLPLNKLNGRSCTAVICFCSTHIKIGQKAEVELLDHNACLCSTLLDMPSKVSKVNIPNYTFTSSVWRFLLLNNFNNWYRLSHFSHSV